MKLRALIVLAVTACVALHAVPAGAVIGPRVLSGTSASIGRWPFIAELVEHGHRAVDG